MQQNERYVCLKWDNLEKSHCVDTGMAMSLICLIFAGWLNIKILMGIAIVLLLVNMTCPKLYKPVAFIWFGLAFSLSKISTFFILSFIFYFVVLPIAVIRKILGKDDLRLKAWKKNTNSVFVKRDTIFTAKDFEQPY